MQQIEHQLDAGAHGRVEQAQHAAAGAARRARTRLIGDFSTVQCRDGVGEPAQTAVEQCDLFRVRAFLRREHGGGAVRPGQRIGDVACQYDRDVSHVVGNLGVVDAGKPGECAAAKRQLAIVRIEETMAERSGQASAAVGGGAAAQSKYDAFRSGVDRGANQLAGAESGRRQRIAVGGGDALDAARRSQLDHRGARILSIVRCSETALAKESISCDDRPAQRVMRVLRSQFAAGCLDQRVGQSLAAIGQRHHAAFGAGIAGRHAPAHRLSHGLRGSGFLERIRCQQIPHGQR